MSSGIKVFEIFSTYFMVLMPVTEIAPVIGICVIYELQDSINKPLCSTI